MSTNTRITGRITITPPISHADLAPSEILTRRHIAASGTHGDLNLYRDAWIETTEEGTDTEDGTLLRRTGVAIIGDSGGESSHYDLDKHVQEIVYAYPDRTYDGYLECHCPDYDSKWRVIVRDGLVREIRPDITWPDE